MEMAIPAPNKRKALKRLLRLFISFDSSSSFFFSIFHYSFLDDQSIAELSSDMVLVGKISSNGLPYPSNATIIALKIKKKK